MVMFSAWLYTEKLPGSVRIFTPKLGLILFSSPALSLVLLLLLRAIANRTARQSRTGDLVITWVMAFMFGVHALVLAIGIGMIGSLGPGLCGVLALLMFGLGIVLRNVEPGSPMGIRTAATLASEAQWARVHQRAFHLFWIAGVLGLFGIFVSGPAQILLSGLPPMLALVIAIASAGWKAPDRQTPQKFPDPEKPTD